MLKVLISFVESNGIINHELDYYKNIPESQRGLHKNINKIALNERINAWEKELNLEEIIIFENIASSMLKKFGYRLYSNGMKVKLSLSIYYKIDYLYLIILNE